MKPNQTQGRYSSYKKVWAGGALYAKNRKIRQARTSGHVDKVMLKSMVLIGIAIVSALMLDSTTNINIGHTFGIGLFLNKMSMGLLTYSDSIIIAKLIMLGIAIFFIEKSGGGTAAKLKKFTTIGSIVLVMLLIKILIPDLLKEYGVVDTNVINGVENLTTYNLTKIGVNLSMILIVLLMFFKTGKSSIGFTVYSIILLGGAVAIIGALPQYSGFYEIKQLITTFVANPYAVSGGYESAFSNSFNLTNDQVGGWGFRLLVIAIPAGMMMGALLTIFVVKGISVGGSETIVIALHNRRKMRHDHATWLVDGSIGTFALIPMMLQVLVLAPAFQNGASEQLVNMVESMGTPIHFVHILVGYVGTIVAAETLFYLPSLIQRRKPKIAKVKKDSIVDIPEVKKKIASKKN